MIKAIVVDLGGVLFSEGKANEFYAQPARETGINVLIYRGGTIQKLENDLRKLGVALESEASGA